MRLSDAEKARIESVVRAAASVAAKGRPLDEAFLGKLASEASDPRLSDAQRVAMATSETEQHVGVGRPVNELSAAPREGAAQAAGNFAMGRFVNGQWLPRAAEGEAGGRSAPSGNRYAELDRAVAQARDIALSNGMAWAAGNKELLKLGPAAMQALADVHLRKDSYERFRQGGLSAKTIVAGARWAKKNGVDYNAYSRAFHETHKELAPEDKRMHQKALETLFNAGPGQAGQEAAKKNFNDAMEHLKKRRPDLHQKIEHEQRILKTQQKKEATATKTADTKVAEAKQAQAKQKATKSKLLNSLD